MLKWDYEEKIVTSSEKLAILKKMGSEGWELLDGYSRDTYSHERERDICKLLFRRPIVSAENVKYPIKERTNWRLREIERFREKHMTEPVKEIKEVKPPEVELLHIDVKIKDENKILYIMSEAGWYVKDVNRDRKVDGGFVFITFTKRKTET